MRRPRYADLPIRAKLLVPFVILMIVWGGFGTYVLARGSAREARGRATARLALVLDVARGAFSEEEARLLEVVRLAARTEGVAEAVAKRDTTALSGWLPQILKNQPHDLMQVVDRRGNVLMSIRPTAGDPSIKLGGTLRLKSVLAAAAGTKDGQVDKYIGFARGSLFIAGPIRLPDAKESAVGAIVVWDSGAHVAQKMAMGTKARVVLYATDGAQLSEGASFPFREPRQGLQTTIGDGRHGFEALYAPVSARGQTIGVMAVAIPSSEAIGDTRGTVVVLALLIGFAVLLAVGVGLVTARAITRPVGALVDATKALERGTLSSRAPISSRDEVGKLANSFNRMAEELQASHAELERKVLERTAELERVNGELARASAAKSSFLATMSHELRTPLNAIIGFADMLSDPAFGRISTSETRELSGNILASGRHLLVLINDVLDLAKVEAGRIEVDVAPIELAPLLTEVEAVSSSLALRKNIKLSVKVSRLPRISADPGRLRQVLFNLISNAIKFTQDGGKVVVTARQDGDEVVVSVQDNGPGMTREEQALVFEPFERGSNSRRAEGAGLGLALAQRLVDLQAGRIWVESEPRRGSTFHFTIPVAQRNEQRQEGAA